MEIHHYEFGPDYLEFYLLEHSAMDKIYFAWPQEAVACNLLISEGAIGIRTYPDLNVTVSVTIEIRNTAPTDDVGNWRCINECSLNIPSGAITLSFWGWDHTTGDIPITPGCYRARIYYGEQNALDEEFRMTGTPVRGYDTYKIILWPAEYEDFVVVQAAPPSKTPRPIPPEFCHHTV